MPPEIDVSPLKFKVSPHIVEDLGVNLYTTLSRVLVEYVANAHDADADACRIVMDDDALAAAMAAVKASHSDEVAAYEALDDAGKKKAKPPGSLGKRTLPGDCKIVIEDDGDGMDRQELQDNFLLIGRRRRSETGQARTKGKRVLMGRKGLGKLAGFGVAHRVEVISRKAGEKHAVKISLNLPDLVAKRETDSVSVPFEVLADGGGIKKKGTRIVLSHIVHDSIRSGTDTARAVLAEHFSIVRPQQFRITINGDTLKPKEGPFMAAYPPLERGDASVLAKGQIMSDGAPHEFSYRIRFTEAGNQLPAARRGVRVYAHDRLASAPELLDLNTGVHGFQYISYMDGVVVADFIDDQETDYIATDRQSLRWETPLLAPLRKFLSDAMKAALKMRADMGEASAKKKAEMDPFTKKTIDKAELPTHRRKTAYRIAAALLQSKAENTKDSFYRKSLPLLVGGLGQGEILTTISNLAQEELPDFQEVVRTVTKLTAQEFDEFMTFFQGRLDAIEALRKIYRDVEFKAGKNEKKLHELLKRNPWLIDPTFVQFLTSDEPEADLQHRLAKELGIGKFIAKGYSPEKAEEKKAWGKNRRPDLVFLLGNEGLRRIVIVELKAPNTPLHLEHLTQLKGYIARAEAWLAQQGGKADGVVVEGFLIGTKAKPNSNAEGAVLLKDEITKNPKAQWRVFDIGEILERTKDAHKELRDIYEKAAKRAAAEG
ncbi:MAG: ATP-binding protein [Candidatus Didemnitutus sp.]|nr:ATP-binding protein [Candidatus Didemnitutus sp.]